MTEMLFSTRFYFLQMYSMKKSEHCVEFSSGNIGEHRKKTSLINFPHLGRVKCVLSKVLLKM